MSHGDWIVMFLQENQLVTLRRALPPSLSSERADIKHPTQDLLSLHSLVNSNLPHLNLTYYRQCMTQAPEACQHGASYFYKAVQSSKLSFLTAY